MSRQILSLIVFAIFASPSWSQEERLSDRNSIGWLAYTGTLKIKPKISIHTEYQWRRADGFKIWQQSLLRSGINYAINKEVNLNIGYAFVETFPYGDYPPAFAFPEHRIYEQVVIKNPVGKIDISHRFTLEQRFVGRVEMINGEKKTEYAFLNRMRYRLRTELPLNKNTGTRNPWSVIFQNEVFIGWGKNVGANIFDQNRLAILVGYQLNQNIKLEAGYLNQILQQARRINESAVFQYNNGLMLSTHISLSTIK